MADTVSPTTTTLTVADIIAQNEKDEALLPAPVDVEPGIKSITQYAYDRKNKSDQLKALYSSYKYDASIVSLDKLVDFVRRNIAAESPEAYIISWFEKSQATKNRNAKATELRLSREDSDPIKKLLREMKEVQSSLVPGSKKATTFEARMKAIIAAATAKDDEAEEDLES